MRDPSLRVACVLLFLQYVVTTVRIHCHRDCFFAKHHQSKHINNTTAHMPLTKSIAFMNMRDPPSILLYLLLLINDVGQHIV